jgi:hypothetical protein
MPIADALRELAQLTDTGDLLDLTDGRHTTLQHRRIEQQTLQMAAALAASQLRPIRDGLAAHHTIRLDEELRQSGGLLSPEQTRALVTACATAPLVVIEGQAGTGKSTVLAGIARTHHDDGQQIIATSTAALAAHRLATDLTAAGVPTTAYSTAALHAAITSDRVTLRPDTTLIHDEAALASTREQHHVLCAVQASSARLILVGDPANPSRSAPAASGTTSPPPPANATPT